MAFLLLIAAMMATTLSVFADDDYVERITCDGSHETRKQYCDLRNYMGRFDKDYYKVDLLKDWSPPGSSCREYYLRWRWMKMILVVNPGCYGNFGIRPRESGYRYKGHCGQDNGLGFKIINGIRAESCKFPWMAFILKDWEIREERTSCGGSIVNEKWILTAAHCIISQYRDGAMPPASAITVYTGSLDKYAKYMKRKVDLVVTHERFEYKRLANDVALLRVERPIKYDGCHAPICLNNDTNIDVNKQCIISGWGKSSMEPVRWPRMLRWAYEFMLSRETCDEIYGSASRDGTLCGRATSGGHAGFCSVDSGGPLVCKNDRDGRYYQHGVVSLYFSYRACQMEGMYSQVAYYFSWINGHINE